MTYSATILADSPRAYYRFEESSGAVQDSSGNGYHATTTTITQNVTSYSQLGKCATWGTSSEVQVPYHAIDGFNSNFTIEFWIKTTATSGHMWDHVDGSNSFAECILNTDNKLWIYLVGKSIPGWHKSVTSVNDGNWHHVVYVFSGTSTLYLYIDGSLDATFSIGTGSLSNTTGNFVIGNDQGTADNWIGQIDEFATYPSALSSGAVAAHYAAATAVDITVTPPVASVTYTGLDPTISTTQNPTILPDVVNITFTVFTPTISAGGGVTLSAPSANITFLGKNPTVSAGADATIMPSAQMITFTALDATVTAGTLNTSVAFDGVFQSWHDTLINSPSVGAYGSVDNFGIQNINATGTRHNEVTIQLPTGAFSASLTIKYSLRRYGGETNNAFGLGWTDGQTGIFSYLATYNGNGLTETLSNLTYTVNNMLPGYIYRLTPTYAANTKVYPFFEYLQVDTLTLTYQMIGGSPTISPTTQNITFTGLSATVSTQYTALITPSNVPAITITGFDATIQTPGSVSIGTNVANTTYSGLAPSIIPDRSININVLTPPDILYSAANPAVKTFSGTRAFKYIDPNEIGFTAYDASVLTTIDLGSMLYDEEKIFGFKIGNTSTLTSNFTFTARSANNLASMALFSLDKSNWSTSLTIQSIKRNEISDVIWCKLLVDTTAYVANGTFLINTEQTNA